MRTYFRLLSFATPLGKYAFPYVLFILLAIVFGTLNLALLAPLLSTLFQQNAVHVAPVKPEHFYDIFRTFNYYASYATIHYGIYPTLRMVCIAILISVFLGGVFRYFAERTMENLRIHTLMNLRRSVFNNAMKLDLNYFNNERKGDIISKISTDVQVVQYSVTGTLQVLFKEPLTLLFYLIMLLIISYKITLVAMLIIPIAAFVISRIVRKLKEDAVASHISLGIMVSYVEEALNGIRIIKAFNAFSFITGRFDEENKRYSKILRSMSRRQQLASPVSEFLGIVMVVGIVLYGGSLVLENSGELTGPTFIAYIALFSQILRPAKAISGSFSNIHSGIAAGERILALIDEKPSIIEKPDAIEIENFSKEIRFANIQFRYQNKNILENVCFSIPKGKTVALVGPSGAGKSTLMDLIPRFIDPQAGQILIDGKNTNDFTIESLRNLMGIVNQESILYNASIFQNIAFARPQSTMEEVVAAAKIANAHEFIMAKPEGYESNIGDKGSKLSGGQRQRLCIARAVLNNPPLMLLDEATSSLDTESEMLVQDALYKLMENRTSLIIAHRLSTIQKADNIIVLDGGRIVEQGTHYELMAFKGLYNKLIKMQTFLTEKSIAGTGI